MSALFEDDRATTPAQIQTLGDRPTGPAANAMRLDSCARWEAIVVSTQSSVYELIVLDGKCGNVLMRGGKHLPDFRPVTLIGATTGGRALRQNVIDVDFRMELRVDHQILVTSPVRIISRGSPLAEAPEAGASALLTVATR
jgi:hypothetical protein